MRTARAAFIALVTVAVASCTDLLLGPEPADDPLASFDSLWEQFDRHYSFFQLKQVDWDEVRTRYRPRVRDDLSERGLLSVVSDMLDELEDGHINVFTDEGTYGYSGWFSGYPRSYLPGLVTDRVGGPLSHAPGGQLLYAEPEPGVVYVRLQTFRDGMATDLDWILRELQPLDGLILDIRHNGGGSDSEVRDVAGRLVSERRLYRTVRLRNGPEHDDFTEPIPSYVEPRGPAQFLGPVVLLTNRRTFSSAESFILAVRTRGDAVVVGDTTGGGSGNPMFRELPNGWRFRLPRWISYDVDGRTFEGVGLGPDTHITFDTDAVTDPILEEAIRVVQAGGGVNLATSQE